MIPHVPYLDVCFLFYRIYLACPEYTFIFYGKYFTFKAMGNERFCFESDINKTRLSKIELKTVAVPKFLLADV